MDHSTLATRQPPGKMSYEEFLAWCDEDTWAEWIEGQVIMVSPASERHRDLQRFLQAVLGIFVEQHGLGRVLGAPFHKSCYPASTPVPWYAAG